MNLEADMPFWMSLVDFFLSQIGNCGPVDEGLNTSSLGDDTKFIPFAIFNMVVRMRIIFGLG